MVALPCWGVRADDVVRPQSDRCHPAPGVPMTLRPSRTLAIGFAGLGLVGALAGCSTTTAEAAGAGGAAAPPAGSPALHRRHVHRGRQLPVPRRQQTRDGQGDPGRRQGHGDQGDPARHRPHREGVPGDVRAGRRGGPSSARTSTSSTCRASPGRRSPAAGSTRRSSRSSRTRSPDRHGGSVKTPVQAPVERAHPPMIIDPLPEAWTFDAIGTRLAHRHGRADPGCGAHRHHGPDRALRPRLVAVPRRTPW